MENQTQIRVKRAFEGDQIDTLFDEATEWIHRYVDEFGFENVTCTTLDASILADDPRESDTKYRIIIALDAESID